MNEGDGTSGPTPKGATEKAIEGTILFWLQNEEGEGTWRRDLHQWLNNVLSPEEIDHAVDRLAAKGSLTVRPGELGPWMDWPGDVAAPLGVVETTLTLKTTTA